MTRNEDRARRGEPPYDFDEADMPMLMTPRGIVFIEGASELAQPGMLIGPPQAPPAGMPGAPGAAPQQDDAQGDDSEDSGAAGSQSHTARRRPGHRGAGRQVGRAGRAAQVAGEAPEPGQAVRLQGADRQRQTRWDGGSHPTRAWCSRTGDDVTQKLSGRLAGLAA